MNTNLRFVNLSQEIFPPGVFFFQKNTACESVFGGEVIWRVIYRCFWGWSHPLVYSSQLEVAVRDAYGNCCRPHPAYAGIGFSVQRGKRGGGWQLERFLPRDQNTEEIEVFNNEKQESVECIILRDGSPLARRMLAPGESARFAFDPVLIIGADHYVKEGEFVRETSARRFYSRIRLENVRDADLVMTGGGLGESALPLRFELRT